MLGKGQKTTNTGGGRNGREKLGGGGRKISLMWQIRVENEKKSGFKEIKWGLMKGSAKGSL